MRAAVSALALAFLVVPRAEAQRPAVHVARASDGRGLTIELRGQVDAPLELVERIIADVGRYPTWIPAITSATPDRGDVEVRWKLPWPLGVVRERVRLERRAVDGNGVVLSWSQVHGDLRRDEGSWTLRPDGERTLLYYRATFQLHRWVPRSMEESAQRRAAFRLMNNLQALARSLLPALS